MGRNNFVKSYYANNEMHYSIKLCPRYVYNLILSNSLISKIPLLLKYNYKIV